MIDLAALDIAGTTVDEGGAVYRALADAVTAAGAPPAAEDIARWMGADKRAAVRALLGAGAAPSTVEAVHADFAARLVAAYQRTPPVPFTGVVAALETLRRNGVKVALMTGFDTAITRIVLAAVGWAPGGLLDAVVSADEVAAGRPAPYLIHRAMERTGVTDVRRVLAAGDTELDLAAGVNAGAGWVVGVRTGGQDAYRLGRARHTHLLPGVADLPALLGLS